MIINRIYYKNKVLHLGHLQILYHNNDFARYNNGRCYAIIDDRYSDITEFKAAIAYLKLSHTVITPITYLQNKITNLLKTDPRVYLKRHDHIIKTRSIIVNQLESPCYHFQIRYEGQLLGYTKCSGSGSGMKITYIFEHILPFIDQLLHVTDICTSMTTSANPNVRVHKITPYYINGLDEKKWTIKWIESTGIPSSLLYQFYLLGVHSESNPESEPISTDILEISKVVGVVNPVKIEITSNWDIKRIEYVFDGEDFRPLTQTVYIEADDKPRKKSFKLKYGMVLDDIMGYTDDDMGSERVEVRWVSGDVTRAYFFRDNRVSLGYIYGSEGYRNLNSRILIHLKDYGYFKNIGYICGIPVYQNLK